MWYFYHQATPESSWTLADAKLRQSVIATLQPPFTTILDLDTEITDGMSREELDKVQYRGQLYFDFDSDDIAEVIPQFQKFLSKLTEIEIDLRQIQLYASGGKGFHIVIPMELFVARPSTAGYTFLPAIYKEMAQELYVDTLDMRVYSARKGRMFRTENVLRTNGKYKVQLSVQQAREITPELYDEWTSQPGDGWQLSPPVLNAELALLFTKARDKVKDAIAKRRSSKADAKLVATFNGDFPESLKMVGRAENIKERKGFQEIATQIAITANSLGQTEAQMLAICEGLIEKHQSDGSRYNSPSKRRKELMRMYHYMQDNPCYEFSAGGIKSLLVQGTPTPDLNIPIEDEAGALDEDEELGINDSISMGLRFNKGGMFLKLFDKETKEHYIKQISELGIDNVAMLKELEGSNIIGYEFDSYVNSQHKGRRKAFINTFTTATNVQIALGGVESTAIQINDAQAKGMLDLMRKKAEIKGQIVSTVPREGVDVVKLPDTEEETDRVQVIYAGPASVGVHASRKVTGVDGKERNEMFRTNYRLSTVNQQEGEFKSDVLAAPKLEDNEETQQFFDHLLKVNTPEVMANILGYYLACFLTQVVRHSGGRFPLLQVYGNAGAGKTSFNKLLGGMHFYNKEPVVWAANSVTPFALTTMLQSSASIPVIFDELKKRELGIRRAQEFLMIMRNNYTGNSGSKGRVVKDVGVSSLTTTQNANVAPLVFLAEELETQTAILDRSVNVHMPVIEKGADVSSWYHCYNNRKVLGRWGSLCVQRAMGIDIKETQDLLEKYRVEVGEASNKVLSDRPIFNTAVVLLGLEFGRQTLSQVFGERYNAAFEGLKAEVLNKSDKPVHVNQSEPSKVLTTLAALTGVRSGDPFKLNLGEDYMASVDRTTQEPCVDIHLRNAWDKYSRHKRSQGEEVLYNSEGAFISAMSRHRAALDTVCAGSELKGGRPSVRIVRFSLRLLYDEEGVEEFQDLERTKVFKKELTNSN